MKTRLILTAAVLMSALSVVPACAEAVTEAASEAFEYTVIPYPDYSIGLNDDGTFKNLDVSEYVTLPESYDTLVYTQEAYEVTEETVSGTIDGLLSNLATAVKITDRAVEEGDNVNVDYTGLTEGEAFPNNEGTGVFYTWDGTEMVDSFMDQLVGVMPGETLSFQIQFPEEYTAEEYSGKPVDFTVTVNYIDGGTELPELTDELVAEHWANTYGVQTVEELETFVREQLEYSQRSTFVMNWLAENADVSEVPQQLIDDRIDFLEQELKYYGYYYYNLADADLMAAYLYQESGAENFEELVEYLTPTYTEDCRMRMIIQAACAQLGITVAEEDLEGYDSYIEQAGSGYVYQSVMSYKLGQTLTEMAGAPEE